jgi:TRAP-type C4-dicarboxylate transport system permease small subunit
MLKAVEKALFGCELVLVLLAVVSTFALMILTSADAASRYLFNNPITGAYEISEKYLMVASIFLGLSYAYRGGVFIRVTFLVDMLPASAKLLCNYAAQIISLLFCVILVVATLQEAIRAMGDDTTLSALPIPIGPAYFLVPIGFFTMGLLMLIDLARVRAGQSHLLQDGAPTTT